ncbi:pseudouridine synthase [Streptococcus ictaluri]|uniref:Pseudouridine synthase n=1 Tax=Streptococcus ictaluri 707-05 TaxID=764299 RepID=G5K5Z0_9STRE|nr:pseudouridine synthase [Streptococcus ictaluri]EHI68726.1 pseudouridylate synthase [Streptococcus ictaluri 707-05]
MRLDKLLGISSLGSRNQVKTLIKSQAVKVDGQVVIKGNQNVDPGLQVISVRGKVIQGLNHRYFIVHKPAGVVTACKDTEHRTILDLIDNQDHKEGLYPIGRLDRDTEGLILVTDNGPLGFRMLHPKHHVDKTYLVSVNGYLRNDAIAFFQKGVSFLDQTVCKPARLEILKATADQSDALLTISEGKFHQVKKMFLAYGLKVIRLKRLSFGIFQLGDLALGQYRELTLDEQEKIKTYLD